MDNITEKVDQLINLTASLKDEINDLRTTTLNAKINELETETAELRREVNELRYALFNQNAKILALINQQGNGNDSLQERNCKPPSPGPSRTVSRYSKHFPISSISALAALEDSINDGNSAEILDALQHLLIPQDVPRSLSFILTSEVIMNFNVDGHDYEFGLLNYTSFMDLLYQAATVENDAYSHKEFLDDIRHGVRLVKNCCAKSRTRSHRSRGQEKRELSNTIDFNGVENLNDQAMDDQTETIKKEIEVEEDTFSSDWAQLYNLS